MPFRPVRIVATFALVVCSLVAAVSPAEAAESTDVYRFWSPKFANAHFFTTNKIEADDLRAHNPDWVYEGVAFKALPASGESCSSGSPVYRFFSSRFASHFFTITQAEADDLRAHNPDWAYEGVAYCADLSATPDTIPLYRFWSSKFAKHFYTANKAEADDLRAHNPDWAYEGVAYHVLPLNASSSISTLQDTRITQSSGLTYSTKQSDLVYTHNDFAGSPTVFGVRPSSGQTVSVFDLSGCGTIKDAESIRTDLRTGTIYLADIGDNTNNRTDRGLCAFAEPAIGNNATVPGIRYPVSYPFGPRDAESLLINPITGAVYIITKEDTSRVVSLTLPLSTSGNLAVDLGKSIPFKVTDATFTPDGRWVLMAVDHDPDTQVFDASTWTFVGEIDTPAVDNGESITMEPDGTSFLVGSEGVNSPIYRVAVPQQWQPGGGG